MTIVGKAHEEIVMAEDRDTLLQHYREMRKELLTAIHGLSDELMTERSLDAWSVKDHLAHLALKSLGRTLLTGADLGQEYGGKRPLRPGRLVQVPHSRLP
jgi:hypothetical protein